MYKKKEFYRLLEKRANMTITKLIKWPIWIRHSLFVRNYFGKQYVADRPRSADIIWLQRKTVSCILLELLFV